MFRNRRILRDKVDELKQETQAASEQVKQQRKREGSITRLAATLKPYQEQNHFTQQFLEVMGPKT